MATAIKKIMGVERNSIRKLNKLQLSEELFCSSLFSDANLVAYYRFNTGLLTTDSKGSNTLTNNNVAEGVGRFGVGADFGSTNTDKYFVSASNVGITGASARTMCAWFKYLNTGQVVIYGVRTDSQNFSIRISSSAQIQFGVFGANDIYADISELTVGDWYHVVFVYTGTTMYGYLNGSQIGTKVASLNTGDSQIFIGASQVGGSKFTGIIDDVAIFSRALTATEVLSLYNSQIKKFMGVSNV